VWPQDERAEPITRQVTLSSLAQPTLENGNIERSN
jgi:hypothetical protein